MKIALRHGAGGEETSKLIHGIFATYFQNRRGGAAKIEWRPRLHFR